MKLIVYGIMGTQKQNEANSDIPIHDNPNIIYEGWSINTLKKCQSF